MLKFVSTSFRTFIFLTFVTGILYPLTVTGFAERFFPFQSGGSLVRSGELILGSELLAQKFTKNEYFWPRPSASDYSAVASGASNASPTNSSFKEKVLERKNFLLNSHPGKTEIPAELLFTSGSGLDPHVSPASVFFQWERVAKARKLDTERIKKLRGMIEASVEKSDFGFIGENRINVLRLNLQLDSEFGKIER
ncbi:potassium-transporting ATPase subunit KdpC [Leptospira gomenensis]|uniref:Potassium-transporting ATPase KdpC subunit n=1 Tax=Leptospira gomenensis TaxID=2484974 RepID=A0A5F1Z0Z9_9LEPT|nr:potassium-transporting ATPase subunit KdpC [Leptospira gomenensis]TGK39214.1 potassium-transporting ATPase subunit KdpC [Leptospira gomenensis]TGK44246.1 potassium-transporting ATPase subunit KdpC [Leptospira gomenensis]TGK45085.1 potassium-transporting ATPase subunit KdpC [Leptospira gomenensis]TGK65108.1 potassium-transporting ATPase subunit KdpC [Leptospira gomenensis]